MSGKKKNSTDVPPTCIQIWFFEQQLWNTSPSPTTMRKFLSVLFWCTLLLSSSWVCAHVMHVLSNNTTLCEMEWQWKECVCAIKLLRTYVWAFMRGAAVFIAFYVCVFVILTVCMTWWHTVGWQIVQHVCACVFAHMPETRLCRQQHMLIFYSTCFFHAYYEEEKGWIKRTERGWEKKKNGKNANKLLHFCQSWRTSIQFLPLPASMRISTWINSC